ncbi:MAG: calcium/sodium antiporter [Acidimicrobiaceae bacterium]|nr:calcium/sodium antiporter [Acidimicrobiaceae bacterium]MCY4280173.1 calcium/sodium antiporter [Acidimicrobiaceae bacterium]MCY4293681.1 calcium/sodium antiporter [Acidimicrobiaceae bacterium]
MLVGLVLSIVGLVVLSLAADQFVRGAARLAVILRIAPIVVGAVVVGFGTSAPELLVSALAAVNGRLDIGVGNIVGSNVANISLVLGTASFVAVVPVSSSVVRRDAAVSVAAVGLFALLVQRDLTRLEGALLLLALGAWFVLVLRGSRAAKSASSGAAADADAGTDSDDDAGGEGHDGAGLAELEELVGESAPSLGLETARTLVSLALVAGSAYILVEGAERVAEALDLSGGFVGYTMVAVGTSAPELVTAVAAARQRQTELLVGNLLGSNVFNSLAVGGVIALVGPGPVGDVAVQTLGAGMMVVICVTSWADMAIGHRVSRGDGVVLLALWLVSIVLLAG